MKKSGSISEFIEQRDRELSAAFREILLTADMPLSEMFAAAAKRPCSRFWVGGITRLPGHQGDDRREHLDPDGIGNARQKARNVWRDTTPRGGAATFRQRMPPGTGGP